MDTELKATTAVKDIISETDCLEAFIREKDKEPCWDGYVCIHSDKHYSKKDIKKVNVQVKGRIVNPREAKEHINFSIDYNDLIAFKNDGGSIYFVVYIDKYTHKTLQVYYTFLLPESIKKIISTDRDSYPVRFKKFPSDIKDVEALFLSFYTDSKKQGSFANAITEPPSIFAQKRDFKGFSFSITSSYKLPSIRELPQYLEGKSLSIYGHLTSVNVPIPVEYIDELSNVAVSEFINIPIKIEETTYYDGYKATYFKDKAIFEIGSCVKITINKNASETTPVQVDYKVAGNLSERIIGLKFFKAAIVNHGFCFANINFDFNTADKSFMAIDVNEITRNLDGYIKVKKALDILSVQKELDLDKCDKNDYEALNALVTSIVDKKLVRGNAPIVNKITALKISNINIAVLYTSNGDNSYIITGVFNSHLDAKLVNNTTGEEILVSQFIGMSAEDFLHYDNLNIEFILEDYKCVHPSQDLYADATDTALEFIKAYDISTSAAFLEAASKMFNWLESVSGLSQEILIINKLQIALRQRALNYGEKLQLNELIKTTDDSQIKCCAFLLLNEQEESQKLLTSFDEATYERFKEYPIYKFYKQI